MNKSTSDSFEIDTPRAYFEAMRALNDKTGPPALLRLIMNAFESYRQARKIGWSRPWNKYGVMTFRSYRLRFPADDEFVTYGRSMLAPVMDDMPSPARAYVDELLSAEEGRERLMGFLFFHEIEHEGQLFEGVTLSFGRINERKRHRDRLDIVMECPIDGAGAGAPSRLRIYVDPFEGVKPPLWETERPPESVPALEEVFEAISERYRAWERTDSRLWDHWTSQYIDYFGPRRLVPANTHFPVNGDGR